MISPERMESSPDVRGIRQRWRRREHAVEEQVGTRAPLVFFVEDPKHLGTKLMLKGSRMQAQEQTISKP